MAGLTLLLAGTAATAPAQTARPLQYLLVNRMPGNPWHHALPQSIQRSGFDEVRQALPQVPGARIRFGVGFIFSYLDAAEDAALTNSLGRLLSLAAETDTPVFIQLDGDNWWGARPDLWNWWDPARPGYDPANRVNVEWTGWDPAQAVKIAWRNWGRQIRVLPPPNLASPRYRQACQEKLRLLVPQVLTWWRQLPDNRKDLFVGLKVGHESSIGVNAWHYPGGNDLLNRPAADDPQTGLKAEEPPARGVSQIGYAAVKTAGLRSSGSITEDDLAEVVRRHLDDLSRQAAALGVPRERLFTHGAGWKDGEKLYRAATNAYACPGWSFYRHAADPAGDPAVQECLRHSDAPFWAAVEWLYQGPSETDPWRQALEKTLADPRCRFLCIYNWEGIRGREPILRALRATVAASAKP